VRPHLVLLVLWIAVELALLVRRRSSAGSDAPSAHDRGSLRLLWILIPVAIASAFVLRDVRGFEMPGRAPVLRAVGSALMLCGLVVRLWAVRVLGRFFTVDVAIQGGHELVERGPYRVVRHPSYSGLVLLLVGLACALGSWLSALALLGLVLPALGWRMVLEERALRAAFGAQYAAYARRTWRLVPFVV
jgi:protein-S-isoprenylcysteine O-methyltransferase